MVVFVIKKTIMLILIPLLTLVTVQICLKYPDTRGIFTSIEKYENINYTGIDDNSERKLMLNLTEGTPSKDIVILYNGYEVGYMDSYTRYITIRCDGVLQINNKTMANLRVDVSSKDELKSLEETNSASPEGISTLCYIKI